MARTPLSDTPNDKESLNADSILGLDLSHQGMVPSDMRGVTRKNPLSDVSCNSDSLDVRNDINSGKKHIKVDSLASGAGYISNSQDVGNDIGSVKSTLRSKTLLVVRAISVIHRMLVMTSASSLRSKSLLVMLAMIATHCMSVMTSALV